MHYTTGEILSVCGSHGSMHDFKIFKKSMRKLKFKPFFIVDKGYLGIKKLGFGCLMPSKAKKTEKLDSELKKLNREIGRRRIQVEHVFGSSVHDKFHRTLILSGFCLLKIAKISLNSSFFPKPIKR